jgi:hypothetical protein
MYYGRLLGDRFVKGKRIPYPLDVLEPVVGRGWGALIGEERTLGLVG